MSAPDPRAWLDQVDARANAATDGPWRADRWEGFSAAEVTYSVTGETSVADLVEDNADAEFIASARTDLPAATTALRAVLDRLDKYGKHIPAVDDMDASEAPPEYWQGARDAVEHTVADLRIAITTALEDA